MTTTPLVNTMKAQWSKELRIARQASRAAGLAIRDDFGLRHITSRKGPFDVQLRADNTSQRVIIEELSKESPLYPIVAEEGLENLWESDGRIWVVDPLDGTNNFGYGVAHCAIAISLFDGEDVTVAVVRDPLLGREFAGVAGEVHPVAPTEVVTLPDATVSLISNYTVTARSNIGSIEQRLGQRCKRVFRLWAPALDLALVANDVIDAVVCLNAKLLDVCAGAFLVKASGGHILGMDGRPLNIARSMWHQPVSFIASRQLGLARDLVGVLGQPDS
ncbi:MAG TPA: inositol monophosphatase [Micromonosporaceae bacterium]